MSVVNETVRWISAMGSRSPIRNAAPPAAAVYSSASEGAPCATSEPMARPYVTMPAPTRPMQAWIPAVPALQANS